MKLRDHLDKQQLDKLNQLKKPNKPKQKPKKRKKKENINWKHIMGMDRDTYKRGKGGAIRRK
jgi:hypothetical protein